MYCSTQGDVEPLHVARLAQQAQTAGRAPVQNLATKAARTAGPARYGDDYSNERPGDREGFDYYRQAPGGMRDDDDDGAPDGYGHDWPECQGKCYAGACKLHLTYPDCCYSAADTSYGDGYAQQQSQVAGGSKATYRRGGNGGPRGQLVCSKPEEAQ